jgi:hypothetical protein
MFAIRSAILRVMSSITMVLVSSSSALAQQARVVAEEVREFEILVKDQSCGKNLIKITDTDDGMTLVATEAKVTLDYFVYKYRYEFHGKEAWQGNHLIWVDDWALDAGTKLSVRARVDSNGSIIEANGKAKRTTTILDMTTNYWRAPEGGAKNAPCSLLNADQGTIHSATVEYLGIEAVMVMGHKLDCTHFRLRGGVTVDLWLDDRGRMVWQKAVEEGYPAELRLRRLTNSLATARAPTAAQR